MKTLGEAPLDEATLMMKYLTRSGARLKEDHVLKILGAGHRDVVTRTMKYLTKSRARL